ncbi:MAG: hypothetical protein K2L07_08220 [Lachnospiraceae bacterium]|nr:hypothetical protein [Lachnospiraceae bacterium]
MYELKKDNVKILGEQRETVRFKSVRANVQCVRNKELMPNTLPDLLQKKRVADIIQYAKEDAPMPESLPGILTGLKRHHIIPDSILQSFWNKVSENAVKSEEDKKLFERMKNMAFHVHKRRYAEDRKIIRDEIRLMDEMREYGQIYSADSEMQKADRGNLSGHNMEEIDEEDLRSMFVWMPGNIVIGPAQRQLEPGNTLDREAMLVAGKDSMKTQELYAWMLQYIQCDVFDKHERISELLTEHMESPYVNDMEVGKFVKKGIRKVPPSKYRPWMLDIREGCDGEKWLLEDALTSIRKMRDNVEDERLASLLDSKEQEFRERLGRI